LESIAKGIAAEDVEHINLTLPEGTQQAIPPFSDELVIIGAPVYGGRLPVDAINRFKRIKTSKTFEHLNITTFLEAGIKPSPVAGFLPTFHSPY
jgi:hypothetical protein